MKGDLRCVDGRLFRHDPQHDDPDLETDVGTCPDCEGKGCEARIPSITIVHSGRLRSTGMDDCEGKRCGGDTVYLLYEETSDQYGTSQVGAVYSSEALAEEGAKKITDRRTYIKSMVMDAHSTRRPGTRNY